MYFFRYIKLYNISFLSIITFNIYLSILDNCAYTFSFFLPLLLLHILKKMETNNNIHMYFHCRVKKQGSQ
jgi:hypothetical protein